MSRIVMLYRTFPKLGVSAAATVLLVGSVAAQASYLADPAGPSAEHVDAGVDRTSSYSRHGNSRGGFDGATMNSADLWYSPNATRTNSPGSYQVRVGRSQEAVAVDLTSGPPAPIALRSATLDKSTAIAAPVLDPVAVVGTFVAAPAPVVSTLAVAGPVVAPQAAVAAVPADLPLVDPGSSVDTDPNAQVDTPPVAAAVEPFTVSEPGSMALLGLGLLALVRLRARV